MSDLTVGSITSLKTESQADTEAVAYLLRQQTNLSPELRFEYEAHAPVEPFLMIDGAIVNATTWRALQAEMTSLRTDYHDRMTRLREANSRLFRAGLPTF